MSSFKLGLAAFACLVGLPGMAQAQKSGGRVVPPVMNFNTGFAGTYGVPGTYSNYGVNGLARYYAPPRTPIAPQTYNNLGGLTGIIKRQTGRPTSNRVGSSYGVSPKRPKP